MELGFCGYKEACSKTSIFEGKDFSSTFHKKKLEMIAINLLKKKRKKTKKRTSQNLKWNFSLIFFVFSKASANELVVVGWFSVGQSAHKESIDLDSLQK